MPEDRRHAAIMFTDIVGYTALMGRDEDAAFDMLARNHTLHEALIEKHNGILIKEVGDGTLASFPLASNAVRCAMDIQKEAKDQSIPLKIGIHEGEMVFAGGDVLGDGVNIASRLQEYAHEGCITISGKVYSDVKNKSGINIKYIGDKKLKNVSDPVKVYEVLCEKEEQKSEEDKSHKAKNKALFYAIAGIVIIVTVILIWQVYLSKQKNTQSLENILDKSIAVIPFWNDSPDPDNTYFCSGMEEDIRIHLLKIADLNIESRQSVEKYRENSDIDVTTIGKELGVAFIVEGSVQKLEDNIRVRVQLINAKTGDHIWAETYDGDYTIKLLEFQSNTAKQIASSLNTVLTPEENQEIEQLPTNDMRAYDFMMRGRNKIYKYWDTRDAKPLKLARKLIDIALEIDPQYEDAIAAKSSVFIAERNYDSALVYAKKVLEIDPESGNGLAAMGDYYRFTGNGIAAIENYELALKNYRGGSFFPKSVIEHFLGILYCSNYNDYKKGLRYIQDGINDADSFGYVQWGDLGQIFLGLGDYEKAKMYNQKLLESEYGLCWSILNTSISLMSQGKYNDAINFLDSICGVSLCEDNCNHYLFQNYTMLGQFDIAEKYFNQYLDVGGTQGSFDNLLFAYTYKEIGQVQKAETMLNNVRVTLEKNLSKRANWGAYLGLSMMYALLDEKDESLKYLSDAIDLGLKWGYHNFLPICPFYKNYWNDPEFKALVRQAQEERAAKRKQVEEMIVRGEIDL